MSIAEKFMKWRQARKVQKPTGPSRSSRAYSTARHKDLIVALLREGRSLREIQQFLNIKDYIHLTRVVKSWGKFVWVTYDDIAKYNLENQGSGAGSGGASDGGAAQSDPSGSSSEPACDSLRNSETS